MSDQLIYLIGICDFSVFDYYLACNIDNDKKIGDDKHYLALQNIQRSKCECCIAKC